MRILSILPCLLSATALASTFHDDQGFALDIAPPPDQVLCVVVPEPTAVDPRCADLARLASMARGKVTQTKASIIGMALVRSADTATTITILRQAPQHAGSLTEKGLEDLVDGLAQGIRDQSHATVRVRARDGRRWERTTYGDVDALRYVIEADAPPPAPQRFLGWLLYGEKATYVAMFSSDAAHEEPARALAERAMAKVKLPPMSVERRRVASTETDYQAGYRAGYWFGRTLAILFLAAIGLWIFRRARRS